MYEMDKGDHKQLCRLCLAIIPSGEGETIAEIERGFLEILLINIDLNISDDIVACNKCLKELQDGFNFKSACFYVDDSIAPFVATGIRVDIKEVFQREMGSTTEVNLEDVQICRLCMLVIEGKALHFNTDLDIITNKCLAEVDINTVIEPLICHRCLSHAERLNKFMETCQGVEQRIKDYCQSAGNAIPGKVLLDDLLDYKNYDILSEPIKEERPDFDVNVTMGLKKEETDAITCEEVNIKYESDKDEEMGDSFPSGASNNSRKSGCLKRKRQISQSASKGSKDKSEVVMLKCENCEYETRYNSAMIRHTMKHRDPRAERKFKCDKCPYKTNFTFNLRAHHLIHKDISEVQIHKCENCEFETKYKSSMIQHIVKHRDPTEEREFKCDKCPYATDLKSYLRKHNLVHKDKFEVVMLKCENCEYETRYKSAMIRHMVKHGDSRGEKLFKCDKCPYKTNFTFNLRSHHLIHKDISKVNIHKCENCEFETRYKSSMIQHIIKHRDPAEEREFKCDKCPYATDLKSSLRKHNLIHRDKSEVEMHKCDNCEYETRHKRCMIQHILKHRDPRAEREFKCDKCPYETDFKCNLHTHNLRHKDKSEVEMHKCENCKFETRYKKNIIRHMLKHRDPKSERKF